MRKIFIRLVVLSLFTVIIVACNSDYVIYPPADIDCEISFIAAEADMHMYKLEEGYEGDTLCRDGTLEQTKTIIERYLTKNPEEYIHTQSIESSHIFSISSEGAGFLTIYDDYGSLEYFGVDIFGDMGQIRHSYTFTNHFIVYSFVEILYSEPFHINPMDIPIRGVTNNRYVIFNGRVYRVIGEEEYILVSEEHAETIIERLITFLDINYSEDK